MNTLDQLKDTEVDFIKQHLKGLKSTLQGRKNPGARRGLLTEEEQILATLEHPERGDLVVTFYRGKKHNEVFIANPREPTNPYSILSYREVSQFSGRRMVGGVTDRLEEGEFGLFLISTQDRDMLTNTGPSDRLDFYTIQFEISSRVVVSTEDEESQLKKKAFEDLNREEMWRVYQKQWDFDNRIKPVAEKLFGFDILYAKYKQPARNEFVVIEPEHYTEKVGMLIRDIYPPNVENVLKKDFVQDHQAKNGEVKETIKSVIYKIEERMEIPGGHPDYIEYLKKLKAHLNERMSSRS